jgi:hypothetical protein
MNSNGSRPVHGLHNATGNPWTSQSSEAETMRGDGDELRRDMAIVRFWPSWMVALVETESSKPLRDSLMLDPVEREEESVVLDAFVDWTETVWDVDRLADGVEALDAVEDRREASLVVDSLVGDLDVSTAK